MEGDRGGKPCWPGGGRGSRRKREEEEEGAGGSLERKGRMEDELAVAITRSVLVERVRDKPYGGRIC